MQQWIDKTVYKMQQWMQGRYGHDELNAAACILSLLLIICSFIPSLRFLFLPALALLLWSCFRCYSKNLGKRRAERDAFLHFTGKKLLLFLVNWKCWFWYDIFEIKNRLPDDVLFVLFWWWNSKINCHTKKGYRFAFRTRGQVPASPPY